MTKRIGSAACNRRRVLSMLLVCWIFGKGTAAQQTRPAPKLEARQQFVHAHVVSMRFSTFGGSLECSPGNELQVRPGGAVLVITFSRECHQRDSRRYRDLRVDADLSNKHWRALEQL